jgi:FkbM family methyltransferase
VNTDELPIVIVDVGARGGADGSWKSLPLSSKVIAFEPDDQECVRLNLREQEEGENRITYFPIALGQKRGLVPFFRTASPHCSSNLRPLEELCDRFPIFEGIAIQSEYEIDVVPLDEWCRENDVRTVDFIKLDTQGSELDILIGAEQILESTLIIETEIEFNPIYENQPLFGDLDSHLRASGFELWGLDSLNYCQMTGTTLATTHVQTAGDGRVLGAPRPSGQLMWAQAFYIRTPLLTTVPKHGTKSLEVLTSQRKRALDIALARGLDDLADTLEHILGYEPHREADMQPTIESLQRELEQSREELAALLSSRSYRYTRPLRLLRSQLSRRSRRT